MADDTRSTELVRVEVVGRQFRHDGEEYHTGAELEVPEWQLEGYAGRIERVEDDEDDEEVADEPSEGSDADESGSDAEPTDDPEPDEVDQDDAEAAEEPDESDEDSSEPEAEEDAPSEAPEVDPHPSELTIAELEERLQDVDDVELLDAIRVEEVEADDRKGAKDAIDDRLDALEG